MEYTFFFGSIQKQREKECTFVSPCMSVCMCLRTPETLKEFSRPLLLENFIEMSPACNAFG